MAKWRGGRGPGWLVALAIVAPSIALAGDPVGPWAERLRSPDLRTRLAAGYALDDLGPDPSAAGRALVALLGDVAPFVRAHAASALGEHRAVPDLSVPALIAALRDPDGSVSAQAAVAIGRIGGPAVPALIGLLRRADAAASKEDRPSSGLPARREMVAERAVFALGQVGAPALPPLIGAYRETRAPGAAGLPGSDFDPARAALRAAILEAAPRAGRDGVAPLITLLDEFRPDALSLALTALEAMGPEAGPAAPRLVGLLKTLPANADVQPEVWAESPEVWSVSRILGNAGAFDVAPLLTMARSDDPTTRKRAMMVLGRASAPDPGAIAAMADRLDDPDDSVRFWAASGLAAAGPRAIAALPALLRAIREEPPGEGPPSLDRVAEALDRVAAGPSAELSRSLPLLLELARTGGPWARGQAMQRMGALGPADAGRTRPSLLAGLDDPEPDVRYRAALALWKLGAPGPEIVRRLVGLLEPPPRPAEAPRPFSFPRVGEFDRSSYVRNVANLGEAAKGAIPSWVRLLRVGDSSDQYEAARALARAGPEGVSALIGLATDRGQPVFARSNDLLALAEVSGHDDRIAAAVPAMLGMARGSDGKLDVAVVGLIARLAPNDPTVESTVALGLLDPEPGVRAQMAGVAIHLGPGPSRRLGPAVLRLLWDGAPEVRESTWNLLRYTDAPVLGAAPIIGPLLRDPTADVRQRAAAVLAHAGADSAKARPLLATAMEDRDPSVRAEAARALVEINASLGELDAMTLTMIQDREASRLFEARLDAILQETRPRTSMQPGGGAGAASLQQAGLPPFPWPSPPAPTNKGVSGRDFPRAWLGKDDDPLSAIGDRLALALRRADTNFDSGLFGVPNGFAMLAKMERVQEDGTPMPGSYRFAAGPIPPMSLADYIARLFVERPGHFRVIAFVVTSLPPTGSGPAPLPALRDGAVRLTPDLANLPFRGRDCYVLVYSFQKRPGGLVMLRQDDGLNARTHLIKAGILTP